MISMGCLIFLGNDPDECATESRSTQALLPINVFLKSSIYKTWKEGEI